MVNQSYEKSEKNLQSFDWYIQGFFDFSELSISTELKVRSTLDFFFKLIFFLFFCNGKYDRDDHLYVIDCCAKIAKKKICYCITAWSPNFNLYYSVRHAPLSYICSQQAAFGENYEWRVNVGTNISLSPISTVGKRGAESGISLLDNAPNYLVWCVIQKGY